MMGRREFGRLKGVGFTLIPVTRLVLAELETPLSAYGKLAEKPFSFLFEWVQGGETWGGYWLFVMGRWHGHRYCH